MRMLSYHKLRTLIERPYKIDMPSQPHPCLYEDTVSSTY